jgi:calcineurin-like phosphoesterase family protein
MARYVISDHHFGHANIIDYCDRPFTTPGQMDSEMLDRFYETIDPADILIHLGDVAMDMRDGETTIEYFRRLDGDILVQGNHDIGLNPDEAPFPVLDSCIIEHGDYRFYCTHRPEDIPDGWEGWALHGHHHNNNTEEYPFVACDDQRINVSSELLNYRPVTLETVTRLIDECPPGSRFRDIDEAWEWAES